MSLRAYKDSMDIQKHGGGINLPQRLHENIPRCHQHLLASKNIGGAKSSPESIRNGSRQQQKLTQSITNPNVEELGKGNGIISDDKSIPGPVYQSRSMSVSLKKPPGLDWKPKPVQCSTQNRLHWLSPIRRIEFRKRSHACKFEQMRKRYGIDEIKAWQVYREKFTLTYVVNANQYDAPRLES